MLSSTTAPVFELRLKTFKNRQRERNRGENEKDEFGGWAGGSSMTTKTLGCQNSMSFYFKRESVIGRGSGGTGLATRRDWVDGLRVSAVAVCSTHWLEPRGGAVTQPAEA